MNYRNKLQTFIKKYPLLLSFVMYFIKIKNTGTLSVRILSQKEKVQLFIDYSKKYNCDIFVETGTYKGETINDCKDYFKELYSIELSNELFTLCKERFSEYKNIHILEGNSGNVLPEILNDKKEAILFWLDAHYSDVGTAKGDKDTPIIKELDFIFNNVSNFCILIDDARCFNGINDYPRISFLKKMIIKYNKDKDNKLKLEVKNDIIRIFYLK